VARYRFRLPRKGVELGFVATVVLLAAILRAAGGWDAVVGRAKPPADGDRSPSVARIATSSVAPVFAMPPPLPAEAGPRSRARSPLPLRLRAAGLDDLPPVQPASSRATGPAPAFPSEARASGVPEPAAGPMPRRDPLDLPLREEERWREWLLSVELNGAVVSEGAYVIEEPESGRLAVPVEELRRWRLRIDRDRILTFQGMPFYPLDAVPGAEFAFDRADLRMELRVPAEVFEPYALGPTEPPRPVPRTGFGGFLDYDFLYTFGGGLDERLDGLTELGLFGDLGVLLTSLRFDDLLEGAGVTRLETSFLRDMPEERKSLRLGDSLTGGGSLARPVRFAGIQYATNFATDPAFVTFPLPSIGGLAEQPSVVEVLVDNVRRAGGEVPAGPFSIPNVPVVTGAGEIQLRVTDLLGREKLVTQSYYVSSRLLKAGLHDFSYEAGLRRENFGEKSFDYGDPIAAVTHRYGFSDLFTGEAHLELEAERQSLALGGTFRIGLLGTVTAGAGVSRDGEGSGVLGQFAYEYFGRGFSLGARTRYTDSDFRQFGDRGGTRRTDQLALGLRLGEFGHLGLLLVNQELIGAEDVLTVTSNYSLRLGPGSLIVNAARLFEPEEELAVTVSYSLPLSGNRSAAARLEMAENRTRARAQFRRSRGATDLGLDYRIAAELGEEPRYLDARGGYRGRFGTVTGEFELDEGEVGGRLGVTGSVAVLDGRVAFTRRIGRAFGLVELPGFAGVRIYLDNREVGRTDARGVLLIPGLRPYEVNRLRVELDDLPLGAVVTRGEVESVPFDRAGVRIPFEVRLQARALARLLDPRGEPLPAGLELADREGRITALVGRDGLTEIAGVPVAEREPIYGRSGEILYRCTVPRYDATDILADLGDLGCVRD